MIHFNRPYMTGMETEYIRQAVAGGKISGNGEFTARCQRFFEARYGFGKCLLTTSCTDALEMAAILTGVGPGDEVIVPSYTFVSTALAFVRTGAKVVFADSRADEPNVDASKIEALVTPRTRVIVPVHYAGCACDMEAIMAIARRHDLLVVEDAAQAVDSFYCGGLGTIRPTKAVDSFYCGGLGTIRPTEAVDSDCGGLGTIRPTEAVDSDCGGLGTIRPTEAVDSDCGGLGTIRPTEAVDSDCGGLGTIRPTEMVGGVIPNAPHPRALGSIGHFGCFSFHETKNIISGEGGMLTINDPRFVRRAEIIWEKGTNRAEFFRGEVNKYGWVDVGSSFLPTEIVSAFLWAQLEHLDEIQAERKRLWNKYLTFFDGLRRAGAEIELPTIPSYATNNAHMFYLRFPDLARRSDFIAKMRDEDILCVFHYLPLHSSEFYRARHDGRELPNCDRYADTLVRLPLYCGLAPDQERVLAAARKALGMA